MVKKKDEPKPKGKGKKKEEVKGIEKREEKTPFLLHVENGMKYNLGKSLALAEQYGNGEESKDESESEVSVVRKNTRKGGDDNEEPVAKKKARMDDLEEGETAK
jgi:hypothetical protein